MKTESMCLVQHFPFLHTLPMLPRDQVARTEKHELWPMAANSKIFNASPAKRCLQRNSQVPAECKVNALYKHSVEGTVE